jgi:RES domain-containing protein
MIVYRLSKQQYCNDLSGTGAEKTGGRWNSKGLPVLYTADSRALAMIEVAVHVPLGIIPVNYFMTAIELPGELSMETVDQQSLSPNWRTNPMIRSTQHIGDAFLRANSFLILQAPSASVPGDFNYLVNPKHALFNQIKVLWVVPFEFDLRLFKN